MTRTTGIIAAIVGAAVLAGGGYGIFRTRRISQQCEAIHGHYRMALEEKLDLGTSRSEEANLETTKKTLAGLHAARAAVGAMPLDSSLRLDVEHTSEDLDSVIRTLDDYVLVTTKRLELRAALDRSDKEPKEGTSALSLFLRLRRMCDKRPTADCMLLKRAEAIRPGFKSVRLIAEWHRETIAWAEQLMATPFADPFFQFGVREYAELERAEAAEYLSRHESNVATLEHYEYGKVLTERLVRRLLKARRQSARLAQRCGWSPGPTGEQTSQPTASGDTAPPR